MISILVSILKIYFYGGPKSNPNMLSVFVRNRSFIYVEIDKKVVKECHKNPAAQVPLSGFLNMYLEISRINF